MSACCWLPGPEAQLARPWDRNRPLGRRLGAADPGDPHSAPGSGRSSDRGEHRDGWVSFDQQLVIGVVLLALGITPLKAATFSPALMVTDQRAKPLARASAQSRARASTGKPKRVRGTGARAVLLRPYLLKEAKCTAFRD